MTLTRTVIAAFTLMFALMVPFQASASASASEELRRYVDENTQELVRKLNAEKGLYEKDRDAFYNKLDEALSDFVDFRRIAARVMGRYARQATPEQRDEFVRRFKQSMFESYAQALVSAEDFEIEVTDATINPRDEARASVNMEVNTASGNRYGIAYSMYRNDNGRWLMENIIVEGVNIGLAFRDRFAQEMEASRGDVDRVIANWGNAVAELELDKEMDKDQSQ